MAPRPVLVEWEDASVVDDETWVTIEDAPAAKATVFRQVGWLLEKTAAHVVMTDTLGDKLMGARTRIPARMVRKITYLRGLPRKNA